MSFNLKDLLGWKVKQGGWCNGCESSPSRPVPSCPVPSCPVLSCPVPSCPVLSCPTAEIILRNNLHSADTQMLLDPLLRERGFGVLEGRSKEDLRNMASAAGQACRDFTPPGGETLEQTLPYPGPSSAEFSESPLPTVAGLASDGVETLRTHVLLVSHGAFIRVAVRHLVDGLCCSLPQGLKTSQVYSACPNTGICRFVITLQMEENVPRPVSLHCIFINRKDHLTNLQDS
ncbi:Fructose-2,6-bisphosphatase TIGAR B [Bagarius yarrelli]|uniref:Fructose-2,6-bisphosphatase TIGAR B n=1 Tax=Bagarius yarrelli TaxID=175774 RepID=A0A556V8D7_BAGYA|nr:Fructose-2,6-bisphosphatase TIGAR B [Bagarius yarrelli]